MMIRIKMKPFIIAIILNKNTTNLLTIRFLNLEIILQLINKFRQDAYLSL